MKEIGRELGISIATVSRALSNRPEVNWETRERVLRCARELSYQPHSLARSRTADPTNLIGLIVPDLVHPFFAQVARGISAQLRPHDYGLIILHRRKIRAWRAAKSNGCWRGAWTL